MKLDINSDLGEGCGADELIMPYISSCNIACGGHAGNVKSMQKTISLALEHQVKIGAHPSYPDADNFGREVLDIPFPELEISIVSQIKELEKWIKKAGGTLHHIKPHGALYNEAAINASVAKLLVDIIKKHFPGILLYIPDASVIAKTAQKTDINVWFEVFADRNYHDNLTLVNRKEANAVLQNPAEVLEHLKRIIQTGHVKTQSGKMVPIRADTVCVHGDNPSAIELVKSIHQMILTF